MTRVLRIPVEGTPEVVEMESTLEAYQKEVGGWVESVSCGLGWMAFLDEEGKMKKQPVNIVATRLARHLGWAAADVMCGTVLFLGSPDEDGDETPVPEGVLTVARSVGVLTTDN